MRWVSFMLIFISEIITMSKDTNTDSTIQSRVLNEVKFILKSRKDKNKPTLIRAIFRYGPKEPLVYSTQKKIAPKYWNDKKQLPRPTYKNYKSLKTALDEIHGAIIEVYQNNKGTIIELYKVNGKASRDKFRDLLDLKLRRKETSLKGNSLLNFYKAYNDLRKNRPNANEETIKRYVTTYNNLVKFANGSDILFDDINWIFKEQFINWSYSKPRKHSQNTVNKSFVMIIKVMREAKKNGLHENQIYEDPEFKVKTVKTSHVALTENEVQLLFEFDLSNNPRLEKVKDLFLISCYSSLRIGDFKRITPSNIYEMEGDQYLHMITDKTKEEVYIPINEYLLSILEKYNFKSPVISNQRFNEYIKEVCELAGLTDKVMSHSNVAGKSKTEFVEKWKLVSAHTGRRTWASIMYSKGFPILLLMQCTGHKKESTFFKYIGVSKKEQAIALMKQMKQKQKEISKGAKVVNL